MCIFVESNVENLIRGLPLDADGCWDLLLEAEIRGKLTEKLFAINFENESDDARFNANFISATMAELLALHKTKRILAPDNARFFVECIVSSFPDVSESQPLQNFLLLLMQLIASEQSDLFLYAVEIILLLSQCNGSITRNLFSPTPFVMFTIVTPLIRTLPDEIARLRPQNEMRDESDDGRSDELSLADKEQIVVLLSQWLRQMNIYILRSSAGMAATIAVVESLTKVLTKTPHDSLADRCIDALTEFLRVLERLRSITEIAGDAINEHNEMTDEEEILEETEGRKKAKKKENQLPVLSPNGRPLLRITVNAAGDPLVFGAGLVFRHCVNGIALSEKAVGTTIQTVPKPLLVTRDRCLRLVCQMVTAAPSLVCPATLEFFVIPERKARRRQIAQIPSDDEEHPPQSPPREKETTIINDPIMSLLSRCCLTVPDRKDWRELTAAAMLEILQHVNKIELSCELNEGLKSRFCAFVDVMLTCSRVSARTLAVDIVERLLQSRSAVGLSNSDVDRLIQGIAGRVADSQSAVRAKALESLALLLLNALDDSEDSPILIAAGLTKLAGANLSPTGKIIINIPVIIAQRASDDKQVVRKALLSFLAAVATVVTTCFKTQSNAEQRTAPYQIATLSTPATHATGDPRSAVRSRISETPLEEKLKSLLVLNRQVLLALAGDASVQVRLKLVGTVQHLLELMPSSTIVRQLWLDTVPAGMGDTETSVVSRAADAVYHGLLQPIASVLAPTSFDAAFVTPLRARQELSPPLGLLALATVENRGFLQRCFESIYKQTGNLGDGLARGLQRACEALRTEFAPQEWPFCIFFLLHEVVTLTTTAVPAKLTRECWDKAAAILLSGETFVGDQTSDSFNELCEIAKMLLQTLCLQRGSLPSESQQRMVKHMQRNVELGVCPLRILPTILRTARSLSDEESARCWAGVVLSKITAQIAAILLSGAEEIESVTATPGATLLTKQKAVLEQQLVVVGELTSTYLLPLSSRTVTLLEAIATGTIAHAMYAVSGLSTDSGKPLAKLPDVPVSIRALATLALGMLAVAQESAASRLVVPIVSLTQEIHPPPVRLNALLAFSDLIIRYGSVTDSYVPSVLSVSLSRLAPALVRKQALFLLASLLAQDYVKAKGYVVLLIAACFADDTGDIGLAEIVLSKILLPRQPRFVTNNFIEIICFVNGCGIHPRIRLPHTGSPLSPTHRQRVYVELLKMASDRDKNEISRKIVQQFLGAFLDVGDGMATVCPIPAHSQEPLGAALSDALRLLACRQLKLSFSTGRKAGAATTPGETPATVDEQQLAQQQESYEADLLKRNLAYEILPTLLTMKKLMEKQCSPFLRDLLDCIAGLVYDYKNDLCDLLFNDPLLAQQLQADIKRGVTPFTDLFAPAAHKGRRSLLLRPDEPPEEPLSRAPTVLTIPRMRSDLSARRSMGDAPMDNEGTAAPLTVLRQKQRRLSLRSSLPADFDDGGGIRSPDDKEDGKEDDKEDDKENDKEDDKENDGGGSTKRADSLTEALKIARIATRATRSKK